MGAMMIGESPDLSERVKRQLPQSFLGRVFLTWFNPGPGTGYLFALAGLVGTLALAALATITPVVFPQWGRVSWVSGRSGASMALAFGVLGLAYVTIFLGVGLLLIRLARKLSRVGILSSLLIQAMLLTIACAVPAIIQMTSPKLRNADYTLLQITNPFWTLLHVAGRRTLPPDTPVLLLLVSAAALLVFLLNLPGVARELSRVRIAKPERSRRGRRPTRPRPHPARPNQPLGRLIESPRSPAVSRRACRGAERRRCPSTARSSSDLTSGSTRCGSIRLDCHFDGVPC